MLEGSQPARLARWGFVPLCLTSSPSQMMSSSQCSCVTIRKFSSARRSVPLLSSSVLQSCRRKEGAASPSMVTAQSSHSESHIRGIMCGPWLETRIWSWRNVCLFLLLVDHSTHFTNRILAGGQLPGCHPTPSRRLRRLNLPPKKPYAISPQLKSPVKLMWP